MMQIRKKSFVILYSIMRVKIMIILNTFIDKWNQIDTLATYIFINTKISKMSEQKFTMH